MSLSSQQYAGLADHSYKTPGVDFNKDDPVTIEGVTYKVLEHMDRPSGYQGTIYQRVDTGDIVVAHRGTEPDQGLKPIWQDGVLTDVGMVLARINRQEADAVELTRRALDYANDPNNVETYGHVSEVTVTGHSLGGTLGQITAHKFHLYGETFNAYGPVSLKNRIPEGGNAVINHVMAADPVSAASHHYGQVRMYASPKEVQTLIAAGYDNNDSMVLDIRGPGVATPLSLGSHSMKNFLTVDRDGDGKADLSVLADSAARPLAEHYRPMFEKFRKEIYLARGSASVTASAVLETHAKARETAGQVAGQTLQASGHAVNMATHVGANTSRIAPHIAGATVAAGVHHAGQTVAGAREAAGVLEAEIDRLQGRTQQQGATFGANLLRGAGSLLPDGAQQWVNAQAERVQQAGDEAYHRNLAEAASARRERYEDATTLRGITQAVESTTRHTAAHVGALRHDAIADAGRHVGAALAKAGHMAEAVTRRPGVPSLATQSGDAAQQIATLQSGLIQLGYHHRVSQPLQVNGVFDNATQQAVTAFQAQQNLPVTSTFDLATQRALHQVLREQQIQQGSQREREQQTHLKEEATLEPLRGEHSSSEALRLFSDAQHPQHALYADVKERLEVRGHALPEDRLHQIAAQLHTAGFQAGWEGSLDVYNQAVYALDERNLWGGAAKVPLSEPVPPMHASVEAAHHHDQLQASMQAEFAQRQQMERYAPQRGPMPG